MTATATAMADEEEHLAYADLTPTDLASQRWPPSLGSSLSFSCAADGDASRRAPTEPDVDILLGAIFKEMRFDFEEYFRYLSEAEAAGLDPRRMRSGDEMAMPSNKHDKSHLAFWSAVSCRDSLIVNCDKTLQLLGKGDEFLRPPPSSIQTIRTTFASNLGISKEKFSTLNARAPQIALRCIGGIDLILYLLARLQNRGFSSRFVLGCIMFLCVGADLVLSLCRRQNLGDGASSAAAAAGCHRLSIEDPVRRIRDSAEQWTLAERDWHGFGADVSAAAPALTRARAEASEPAHLPRHVPEKTRWKKEWRKPLELFGWKQPDGSGDEFARDRRMSEDQVE